MTTPVILQEDLLLAILHKPRKLKELMPFLKPLPQQLFTLNSLDAFTHKTFRRLHYTISKLNSFIILDDPNDLDTLSTFLHPIQQSLQTKLLSILKSSIKHKRLRRALHPLIKRRIEYTLTHLTRLIDFLTGDKYKDHEQLLQRLITSLNYLSHLINIEQSLKENQ